MVVLLAPVLVSLGDFPVLVVDELADEVEHLDSSQEGGTHPQANGAPKVTEELGTLQSHIYATPALSFLLNYGLVFLFQLIKLPSRRDCKAEERLSLMAELLSIQQFGFVF